MYNQLNQLAAEVHKDNDHWWRDPSTGKRIEREKATTLFLVISEITEAGEGERKGIMDDHLGHRPSAEVELADALIRIFDYMGAHGYDLDAQYRRAYPTLGNKDFNEMRAFFAFRYFKRSQTKPWQLLQMIQAVARIAELEQTGDYVPEGSLTHKANVESMLAWFISLVFDYCGIWSYDIAGAFTEKRAYNATRADHKNAARLAAGGKKW